MDGLRGILAVAGIAIVALVYWYTQKQQAKKASADSVRIEPALDESFAESVIDAPEPADAFEEQGAPATVLDDTDEPVIDDELEPEAAEEPQKIIALRMVARGAEQIPGKDLLLALRGLGLKHGKFGIFHSLDDQENALFSVASLVEPGSFDIAAVVEQELPGVSLFMVSPLNEPGQKVFDRMVETARALAKSLDGEVLDANGSSLSIQRERFIREEIIQFELAANVAT
ncbi:MAG: cell division protein ZipA C-terminal FtsZ-binding domain-containing protein [Pseudomonadota bacterium]